MVFLLHGTLPDGGAAVLVFYSVFFLLWQGLESFQVPLAGAAVGDPMSVPCAHGPVCFAAGGLSTGTVWLVQLLLVCDFGAFRN